MQTPEAFQWCSPTSPFNGDEQPLDSQFPHTFTGSSVPFLWRNDNVMNEEEAGRVFDQLEAEEAEASSSSDVGSPLSETLNGLVDDLEVMGELDGDAAEERHIKTRLSWVKRELKLTHGSMCNICLEENPEDLVMLEHGKSERGRSSRHCRTLFCRSCVSKWIMQRLEYMDERKDPYACPICKRHVSHWRSAYNLEQVERVMALVPTPTIHDPGDDQDDEYEDEY